MILPKNDLEFLEMTLSRLESVTNEQVSNILGYLRGEKSISNETIEEKVEIPQRPMKLWEVADFLGVTNRAVSNYVRQGLIVPVRANGSNRAIGYTAASVYAFAAGIKAA